MCYLGDDDIETDVTHRLAILEEILYILRNDVFEVPGVEDSDDARVSTPGFQRSV